MTDERDTQNRVLHDQLGKPSSTFVPDWVWMSDAPDQAVRYYMAVKAFLFEKDAKRKVYVTDGELAELMNRVPRSVARARKLAEEHNLIEVVETVVPVATRAQRQAPAVRKISLRTEPPAGASRVNCFDEMRRIRAPHEWSDKSVRGEGTTSSEDPETEMSGTTGAPLGKRDPQEVFLITDGRTKAHAADSSLLDEQWAAAMLKHLAALPSQQRRLRHALPGRVAEHGAERMRCYLLKRGLDAGTAEYVVRGVEDDDFVADAVLARPVAEAEADGIWFRFAADGRKPG